MVENAKWFEKNNLQHAYLQLSLTRTHIRICVYNSRPRPPTYAAPHHAHHALPSNSDSAGAVSY